MSVYLDVGMQCEEFKSSIDGHVSSCSPHTAAGHVYEL